MNWQLPVLHYLILLHKARKMLGNLLFYLFLIPNYPLAHRR